MASIDMTPSDLLGATQRNLTELHSYLGQPFGTIDLKACRSHLSRAIQILSVLETMQDRMREEADNEPTAAE